MDLSPTVGRITNCIQIVMITQEHWQRIKAIFHSAQECAPADRASFLNSACGDDESIRQEVESLLAADATNEDFLCAPAYELMAGVLADKKAEFVAGQEVGPYTILSSLGAGGMGEVYLAKDKRLGRKVALKLLPINIARDYRRVRRFEQEARAASALNHPNVCTIHEIGETDNGRQFIAMEYINGLTLRDRMAKKRMKLLEAVNVAAQVAWALEAAHAAGIVHRDIKPENIMLREDGYVKVLDFGIAKLNERLSKLNDINEASTIERVQTEPGTRIGTVTYMSPEQLRELPVDARTDIWSLGVVLHEMVTGTTPFGAPTTNETIAAILGRQPIQFAPTSNGVPAALQHILKKALGKRRRERYQRVKDLAHDLRKLRQQIVSNATQEFSAQPMSLGQSAEDSTAPLAADRDDRSTTFERTKALAVRTAESILSEIKQHPKAATFAGLTAVVVLLLVAPNLPRLSNRLRGLFSPSRQQSLTPLQTRMIPVTNSGSSVCAAISPDGESIAHAEKRDGMQQLELLGLATSGKQVVVPPDNVEYHGVTFSPDGHYLYFTTARPERGDAGTLFQVSLPGGSPRKIMDRVDSPIVFSSIGDMFAFVRADVAVGEYSLIIAAIDGTSERVIATRSNGDRFSVDGPAWSPDGKSIVCGAGSWDKGYHMNLIEFSLAHGGQTTLAGQSWFSISQVAWLNDRSGLIISAREQPMDPSQLWRIPYPQGKPEKITIDTADYRGVSLSRANMIVSVQSRRDTSIWTAGLDDNEPGKQIAPVIGLAFGLSWAGNDKIVFSSMAGSHLNISLINPDGSNRKQLSVNAGDNYTPATSPDGRFIVFSSNRTGSFNIWRMNAEDGSDLNQLTFGEANSYPSCSADSQWVFYDNQSSSRITVWKVPIDGGDPVQLTNEYARMPVVAPDNQFMACRYYVENGARRGIAVIPVQGGLPVKLLPIPVMLFQRVQWISSGHALSYIDIANGVSNIWSYNLDDGSKQQLTNFQADQIFAYAWSPDNKQLACERGAEVNDVITIGD